MARDGLCTLMDWLYSTYLFINQHLLGIEGKIQIFALNKPSNKDDRTYISYINLCANEISPIKLFIQKYETSFEKD